jgi:bifunctional non-homologous end joining protein LigD
VSGDAVRTVRAGRHTVEVHRPDKVLFPGGDGGAKEYTKGDLVDYHRAVAPFMLPHLRGRPLMLERHPDGVDGPRFMQKNTPEHYPDWISRVEVGKEGGTVRHTVCDDTATLLYLADQAALTLHRWLSRAGQVDHPVRPVTTSRRSGRRPGCWANCSTS